MENIDVLSEKLKQLRELHPNWEESSLTIIDGVERRIMRDERYADYCDLDMTVEIVGKIKEIVKSIVVRLGMDDGTMEQSERRALAREKKAYLWLVVLLSRDYKAELKSIEKWVDRELGKER